MSAHTDRIIHWLLAHFELQSSLFHVGQYCGDWRASTGGHQKASFHIILHGTSWLHFLDGRPSVRLQAGEAVLLVQDVPHYLSPHEEPPASRAASAPRGELQPLGTTLPGSVGLACGFFQFNSKLSRLIASLLPDCILVQRDNPSLGGVHAVFDLIRGEIERDSTARSPLITRLIELLFFYGIREAALATDIVPGLATLMRRTEFSALVAAIIESPGDDWTGDTMASFAKMSRATFFKRFLAACGKPPTQFVTLVRMKVAAGLLAKGVAIPRVAEQIGYHSESAFAHAFKRATGFQPGAYRRAQSLGELPSHASQ